MNAAKPPSVQAPVRAPIALIETALTLGAHRNLGLDPARLVRDFGESILGAVAWQGLSWLPPPATGLEPLVLGREGACRCSYTLSADGLALGELTLSHSLPFTPASIEAFDELLRALVYPLRNALLFQSACRVAAAGTRAGHFAARAAQG